MKNKNGILIIMHIIDGLIFFAHSQLVVKITSFTPCHLIKTFYLCTKQKKLFGKQTDDFQHIQKK